MAKISWEFYVQRTGRTLADIFKDAKTIDEAKLKIDALQITYPPDDKIQAVLDEIDRAAREKKAKAEEASAPRAKRTQPRRQSKEADAASKPKPKRKPRSSKSSAKTSASSKQSVSTKETQEVSNEKYFRRVIPTKKDRS